MKKADEVLKALMNQLDIKGGEKYIRFFSSWKELAGRDLSAHSQVSDIRNNVAIVEVDHPAWMQILQMKEKDILAKMKKRFPELGIKRFHLRLVDRAKWSKPFSEEKSRETQEIEEENLSSSSEKERGKGQPREPIQKETDKNIQKEDEVEHTDRKREHFENMLKKLQDDIKKRDREKGNDQ